MIIAAFICLNLKVVDGCGCSSYYAARCCVYEEVVDTTMTDISWERKMENETLDGDPFLFHIIRFICPALFHGKL